MIAEQVNSIKQFQNDRTQGGLLEKNASLSLESRNKTAGNVQGTGIGQRIRPNFKTYKSAVQFNQKVSGVGDSTISQPTTPMTASGAQNAQNQQDLRAKSAKMNLYMKSGSKKTKSSAQYYGKNITKDDIRSHERIFTRARISRGVDLEQHRTMMTDEQN